MTQKPIEDNISDIVYEEVEKAKLKTNPKIFIATILNKLLIAPLCLSAVVLIGCAGMGVFICATAFWDDANGHLPNMSTIFRGLELIFISPIPFFIMSAFSGYLTNVIIPSLDPSRGANDIAKERLPDAFRYISIIKYLFISIIVSTLLVVLLETVYNLNPFNSHANQNEIPQTWVNFKEGQLPFILITVLVLAIALVYYKILDKHIASEMKELTEDNKKRQVNYSQILNDIRKEKKNRSGNHS